MRPSGCGRRLELLPGCGRATRRRPGRGPPRLPGWRRGPRGACCARAEDASASTNTTTTIRTAGPASVSPWLPARFYAVSAGTGDAALVPWHADLRCRCPAGENRVSACPSSGAPNAHRPWPTVPCPASRPWRRRRRRLAASFPAPGAARNRALANTRVSSGWWPWATCTAPTTATSRCCGWPASSTSAGRWRADGPTSCSGRHARPRRRAPQGARPAAAARATAPPGGRRRARAARQPRGDADAWRPALRGARRIPGLRDEQLRGPPAALSRTAAAEERSSSRANCPSGGWRCGWRTGRTATTASGCGSWTP